MNENEFDIVDIPGQMTIQDYLDDGIPESICAVSKIFARARKQMNLAELKAFTYALTNIKFTDPNADNKIRLDKRTLANIVGISTKDSTSMSWNLKRSLRELSIHSFIEIEDEDTDFYESGVTITSIRMYRNNAIITFNPDYMGLFCGLDKNYINLWSSDIFGMKSERSIAFYEKLRLYSDTSQPMCRHGFGVKALKELFDIPRDGKGAYMRKDGHFDRPSFERYVIDAVVEDLRTCKMIQLVANEDGSYYKKVKKGNRVLGYEFCWTVTDRPSIGTATEMAEVKQEVEKNPEVLKVAKDIVNGRKKPAKERTKKNKFNNYELNNNIDVDALEKALLAKNDKEG